MMATHHAAFSGQFNVAERARMSRMVAEAVERQQARIESRFDRFRADLRESRRQSPIASLEAKPSGRDE
jgi:hypothetical protein